MDIIVVMEVLVKACDSEGITCVFVTHDESLVQYATRVIRIDSGKIISDESGEGMPPLNPKTHCRIGVRMLILLNKRLARSMMRSKIRLIAVVAMVVVAVFAGVSFAAYAHTVSGMYDEIYEDSENAVNLPRFVGGEPKWHLGWRNLSLSLRGYRQ
ncbi:MAG: hypothetical protein Ct9H90mP24_0490 [Methanobacteriota archaeon]|nr:MAG: hypothetical protein Ct9H90mP24_0490 [Euryarchaeota archaeon]